VDALKGHDFSRAANATKRTRALAPEGTNGWKWDLIGGSLNKFRIPGQPGDWTGPECGRLFLLDVYVALFGINRGVVKVDAIATKMSFRLVTVCEASSHVLPEPLWL